MINKVEDAEHPGGNNFMLLKQMAQRYGGINHDVVKAIAVRTRRVKNNAVSPVISPLPLLFQ